MSINSAKLDKTLKKVVNMLEIYIIVDVPDSRNRTKYKLTSASRI